MRTGTAGRLAASLSVLLLSVVWGAVLAPAAFSAWGSFALLGVSIVAVVAAFATYVALLRKRSVDRESRIPISSWWPALIAPLVGTAFLIVAWVRAGGYPLWVMSGDMVWNTAQSLFIHTDGGVRASEHPNPAPLTNTLFAISYGPAAEPSLGTIFTTHGIITLALAIVASLAGSLYLIRQSRGLHPVVSACLAIAVGWLPYTGALLGAVVNFGHVNVLTSYLVLWLAWLVYTSASIHPLIRASLLFGLTTVTVASWAPLATVPLSLAAVCVAQALRQRKSTRDASARSAEPWLLTLAIAQFAAYAGFVTLADLRREGEALGQDGAVLSMRPVEAALLLVLLAIGAWLTGRRAKDEEGDPETRRISLGLLAVLVSALPALCFLVLQRSGMPTLWGYYPVKYVSLLCVVCFGVLIGSIAARIPRDATAGRQILRASTAIPFCLVVTLIPFNWFPGFATFAPGLQAASVTVTTEQRDGLHQLGEIFDADRSGANLVLGVDEWVESASNAYLIQLSASGSTDPIRAYAYAGVLNDEQLCDLLRIWQRQVTIHSPERSAEAVSQRIAACSLEQPVVIEVLPAGA